MAYYIKKKWQGNSKNLNSLDYKEESGPEIPPGPQAPSPNREAINNNNFTLQQQIHNALITNATYIATQLL